MADKLLDVNGLTVSVEEKEILHNINLSINKGETHVLMGPSSNVSKAIKSPAFADRFVVTA